MMLMGIRATADGRVEGVVINAARSVLRGVREHTGGAILTSAALDHRIDALSDASATAPNMLATAAAIDLGRDSMARPLAGAVVFLTSDEQGMFRSLSPEQYHRVMATFQDCRAALDDALAVTR